MGPADTFTSEECVPPGYCCQCGQSAELDIKFNLCESCCRARRVTHRPDSRPRLRLTLRERFAVVGTSAFGFAVLSLCGWVVWMYWGAPFLPTNPSGYVIERNGTLIRDATFSDMATENAGRSIGYGVAILVAGAFALMLFLAAVQGVAGRRTLFTRLVLNDVQGRARDHRRRRQPPLSS